jgi:hypothetical protein
MTGSQVQDFTNLKLLSSMMEQTILHFKLNNKIEVKQIILQMDYLMDKEMVLTLIQSRLIKRLLGF